MAAHVCGHCELPLVGGYYRTRRKARGPIGTDRHISPGRWVSTRASASCSCASKCEPVPTH
eukprot:1287168-Prymnesium_polylepis.1